LSQLKGGVITPDGNAGHAQQYRFFYLAGCVDMVWTGLLWKIPPGVALRLPTPYFA